MAGRHALVTGATGFLGRNLVDELLERDWKVTVMGRGSGPALFGRRTGVEVVQADLLNASSVLAALPAETDCLFHLAGDTGFWRPNNVYQHAVNVGGTRNVLAAAAAKAVPKIVYTSTIGVYGESFHGIDERAPQHGRRSRIGYIRSKAEAEEVVRDYVRRGLDVTIMNPCNIVGRHDRKNWARMFRMIVEGTLPGVPPGSGVFCDARAVAKAHVDAYAKGRAGENYILGGAQATMLEFVRTAARTLERSAPEKPTPAILLHLAGRAAFWQSYFTRKEPEITPELARIVCGHQSVNTDKAERELGYLSPNLEQMVSEAVAWMRSEHILAS